MDFFDFDFDFQDCLRTVLVGVFLLGSVQLHAVMGDQESAAADRAAHAAKLAEAAPSPPAHLAVKLDRSPDPLAPI